MGARSGVLRRLRRSREAGVFGLLVFVTGILVLPFLHNLHHRNDHDHSLGGTRHGLVFGGTAAHRHEEGEEEHQHDHDHEADGRHHHDPDDDHHDGDRDAPDPDHGRGSLEHFGLAVTAGQFFVLPTSFTLIVELLVPELDSVYVERYLLGPLQARAPPA
jgi:hypothetical protein